MIVLDTNVLSELMRSSPDARVVAWVSSQPMADLAVTAISLMQIPLGLAIHPEAIRRDRLTARFRQLLQRGFGDRVLPFDHQAAGFCAEIRAARRRAGAPIATEAAMIAAIARQNGTSVATRDAGGFAGCGVVVIDPWQG